jgi:hypothetical protein
MANHRTNEYKILHTMSKACKCPKYKGLRILPKHLPIRGTISFFTLELCTQFFKIQFFSPFFAQNRC